MRTTVRTVLNAVQFFIVELLRFALVYGFVFALYLWALFTIVAYLDG